MPHLHNKQLQHQTAQKLQIRSMETRGTYPGEHWKVDFTVIPRVLSNFRYLLVLVDTFSG